MTLTELIDHLQEHEPGCGEMEVKVVSDLLLMHSTPDVAMDSHAGEFYVYITHCEIPR